MSVIFMDSFDKYNDATQLYQAGYEANSQSPIFVAGRHDNCLRLGSFSAFTWGPTLAPNSNEGWIGFAYRPSGGLTNGIFFRIYEGTTHHLSLSMDNTTGIIQVLQGNGTVLVTSLTSAITNQFYYIEFHFIIDNTTGAVGLRFNGQTSDEVAATGIDTQNGGTAAWTRFALDGDASSSQDEDYDDLYVLDDVDSGIVGAPNNDYLGDMIVECLEPDGAGASTQLTPSAGANWQNVDEIPGHDGDTTYNESATVSNQDTYAMDPLVFIDDDDIKAIQVAGVMRKVDAGARSGRNIIRHVSDFYGATRVLSTSYEYQRDIAEGANPFAGTTQWTIANVDALQAGFDVVA